MPLRIGLNLLLALGLCCMLGSATPMAAAASTAPALSPASTSAAACVAAPPAAPPAAGFDFAPAFQPRSCLSNCSAALEGCEGTCVNHDKICVEACVATFETCRKACGS